MSSSCSVEELARAPAKIPTLLVVRLNGQATGYDLSSPERRRYALRTKDDWHNFRMISFNRRLQRLSLAAAAASTKPSLSPKRVSTRDALRAERVARRRARVLAELAARKRTRKRSCAAAPRA